MKKLFKKILSIIYSVFKTNKDNFEIEYFEYEKTLSENFKFLELKNDVVASIETSGTNYIIFKSLLSKVPPSLLQIEITYKPYSGSGWITEKLNDIENDEDEASAIETIQKTKKIKAEVNNVVKLIDLSAYEYISYGNMYVIKTDKIDINPIDKFDSKVDIKIITKLVENNICKLAYQIV